MVTADVIVIGAGVAGLSVAAALAGDRKVVVVEMEEASAYHASGRSGAAFGRSYGNALILRLNAMSAAFFEAPPSDFTDTPLFRPRPWMIIARTDQAVAATQWMARGTALTLLDDAGMAHWSAGLLRPGYAGTGLLDESCGDLDVHALMQGYGRQLRRHGGQVLLRHGVTAIERHGKLWHVRTREVELSAPILVNAAGAWADSIAGLAGLPPLGLQPLRRTAALIDPPADVDVARMALILDAQEQFYINPEAGRLMISPADETPSPPCDAQPEEIDVAMAVDRYERATGRSVATLAHRWAGLRTFAPDRSPLLGFDPRCPGFLWVAGQGGYGIQIAPALSALAGAMVRGEPVPPELAEALAPGRLLLAGRAG
jgi:D-arginine dehydrogenase